MLFHKLLRTSGITLILILSGAGFCFSQHADFTTILKNTAGVSALKFSPDGKSLLYTLSKVDWENNRRKTEFIILDLASKSKSVLSFKEKGVVQPTWSPSGKYMSFIAISDTTGTALPQVYIKEWPNGKSTCITASRSGVSAFQWSPGEGSILFIAKDTLVTKTGTDRFIQAFEVGNNSYTAIAKPLSSHLYITDIPGRTTKRMTNDEGSVRRASWINDSMVLIARGISSYTGDFDKTEAVMFMYPPEKQKQLLKK